MGGVEERFVEMDVGMTEGGKGEEGGEGEGVGRERRVLGGERGEGGGRWRTGWKRRKLGRWSDGDDAVSDGGEDEVVESGGGEGGKDDG